MSIINYTLAYPVHVEPSIIEPQTDKWYINISNASTSAYPDTNDSGINGNYILNSMLFGDWTDVEETAFETTFGIPFSRYKNIVKNDNINNPNFTDSFSDCVINSDYFIHISKCENYLSSFILEEFGIETNNELATFSNLEVIAENYDETKAKTEIQYKFIINEAFTFIGKNIAERQCMDI